MSKASQSNSPRLGDNPIAIIGMSALFPQAEHLGQYWNNIVEQIDSIIEIPESRWKIEDYFDESLIVPNTSLSLSKGAIVPWSKSFSPYITQTLLSLSKAYNFSLSTPWDKLDQEDLKDQDGNYYKMAYDQAIMLPLLEMAGEKSKY